MKKTLLVSAIAVSALSSINAQADHISSNNTTNIHITNMVFGTTDYAADGTLTREGDGGLFSIDPFFYHTWTATQQTLFLQNDDTWAGFSEQGAFDYTTQISAMTAGQVAVGMYFNWNGSNEIAVLEIFNCGYTVGSYARCNGNPSTGVAMQNGPFIGSTAIFETAPAPIPAASWLMLSGLLGLVGLARRRA